MTKRELLDQLVAEKGGILRTADAVAAGVSKTYFYSYIKARGMQAVQHGVYMTDDAWKDAMFLLHLRCPQAIFSHETALFLHDLTDREPLRYTITVKTGYNASRLTAAGTEVYWVKPALHDLGAAKMETPYGRIVPVYNAERTVCDLIRHRSNMEIQVFQQALKEYARRRDRNLRVLMRYAEAFHVDRILRQYLEVLV